jgi:NTP pyrophosphatase (non-canonical NTP hydrolase)
MLVNLVAEVGEFSGKIAKAVRRSEVCIRDNQLTADNLFDKENLEKFANLKAELILEAGDILWQLTGVLHTIGFTLEDAGSINLEKLSSRAKRGKIDGDGDHR